MRLFGLWFEPTRNHAWCLIFVLLDPERGNAFHFPVAFSALLHIEDFGTTRCLALLDRLCTAILRRHRLGSHQQKGNGYH